MIYRLRSLLVIVCFLTGLIGRGTLYANQYTSTEQTITPSVTKVLYVNKNVQGGNGSGDSWTNAIPELAEALKWAKINETQFAHDSLQIWVAAGTYHPKYLAQNLESPYATSTSNTFLLAKNVQLYGGFSGTEASLNERYPSLYTTVLSADYNNDDQLLGTGSNMALLNSYDNAIRLVLGYGELGNARLDGFQLTGAPAGTLIETYREYTLAYASGITLLNSQLEISQCHFTNMIGSSGGAIHALNSRLKVDRTSFTYVKGGAIYFTDGLSDRKLTVSNSVFAHNHATNWGAGITIRSTNQAEQNLILNCSFINSSTESNGPDFGVDVGLEGTGITRIYNSIMMRAEQNYKPAATLVERTGQLDLVNCLVQNWIGTGNGNRNTDGLTLDDVFEDVANRNYAIKYTGPAFNSGNNALYATNLSTAKDLLGQSRLVNANIDLGAIENQNLDIPLTIQLITDSGESATDRITNVNTPTFSGSTGSEALVTLHLNEFTYTTTASQTGEWSITPTTPLADGTYSVRVTATKVGYVALTPPVFPMIIDTTPPVISGVVNGETYFNSVIIGFNEGSGLINGVGILNNTQFSTLGTHTLVVTDKAGNATTLTFTLEPIIITPSNDRILYVNKHVVGGNQSGDSWANAIRELSYALSYAKNHESTWTANNRLQIWVAAGNYTPSFKVSNVNETGQRDNTFLMVPYVDLYGGFKGDETALTARDWQANATILNGDLLGNDATNLTSTALLDHATRQDNAYHVVTYLNAPENSIYLDGFQIVNGNANVSTEIVVSNRIIRHTYGGGVIALRARTHHRNMLFRNNSAHTGGGMYVGALDGGLFSYLKAVVINSIFIKNHSRDGGNAIYTSSEWLRLMNSAILQNTSSAQYGAAAVVVYANDHVIANSLFVGNSYDVGIIGEQTGSANVTVANNIIAGFSGNGNISNTGLKENDVLIDAENGNYQLRPHSVAVNAGNLSLYATLGNAATETDFAAKPRLVGGGIDIGAYEVQVNCIDISVPTTTAAHQTFYLTQGATIADLVATAAPSSTLQWYTASFGGQPLPLTHVLPFGTHTFYAESVKDECVSYRGLAVQVTVRRDPLTPDAKGIIYVNKNVIGGNQSGSSWANAVPELADALELLKADQQTAEVWVAAGTYTPLFSGSGEFRDVGVNNVMNIRDVRLYGGFTGTETKREARNWHTNRTIISGNIGDESESTDNTKSLLVSDGATQETVLDGFVMEQVYNGTAAISLANSSSRHIINHCSITNNSVNQSPLRIHDMAMVVVANTSLIGNSGTKAGAIINTKTALASQTIQIVNTLIIRNWGLETAGIMNTGNLHIDNSILWDNRLYNYMVPANAPGVDILLQSPGLTLVEPIVRNTITQAYGVNGNARTHSSLFGADPLFTDMYGGDYSLQPGSPAINAGDNNFYNAALLGTRDLNGVDRLRNTTIDVGAFEVQEGDNPLPLRLVSFKAVAEQATTVLTWQTAEEEQTHSFEIERSHDGKRFTKVGTVAAKGTGGHAYSFNDTCNSSTSITYYRLRMVDLDGKYTYSPLVAVTSMEPVVIASQLYPNPATNSQLVTLEVRVPTQVAIYTTTGKLVQTAMLTPEKNQLNLHALVAGVYLVKTNTGQTQKLVVVE